MTGLGQKQPPTSMPGGGGFTSVSGPPLSRGQAPRGQSARRWCLAAFYHYGTYTCLEIAAKNAGFDAQAPGLNDTALATAIDERHAPIAAFTAIARRGRSRFAPRSRRPVIVFPAPGPFYRAGN
jgi:hypothetical protein